ncbi:hypothetical protein DH2020_010590 [Rehmannia glutinosa]|uniref:PPIase cyclophilin-type domain-containing protein n=1 Tax=Rehmannia glutinosa TaxID=99300 RepID=A0ABR0XB23_REHGL
MEVGLVVKWIENLELANCCCEMGHQISSSIHLNNVVRLVRRVTGTAGRVFFVIQIGFLWGIRRLVGTNLCWLKKQKDVLVPEKQEVGSKTMWTSGIVFGKGELLPDCSPHSVAYILELLALRHCAGCHFYRAESRGQSWDIKGNHIKDASFGPPFALIQGTLEAHGQTFNEIQPEHCPNIRRGSVAWVGSGPEFFISLANHDEWRKSYTVFGFVLPEDMVIAEKIARLPTKSDVWNNINVSVLEKNVPLKIQRIKIGSDRIVSNMSRCRFTVQLVGLIADIVSQS